MNGQVLLFPQENELDSIELVQMKFVKKHLQPGRNYLKALILCMLLLFRIIWILSKSNASIQTC